MRTRILVGTLAVVGIVLPVWAHHAFEAEFDQKKPVKLQGIVRNVEWINPHAWIHLDVKDEGGKVTEWMVELGAPNTLLRRGWTKNSIPKGIDLKVEGFQAKDGSPRANGRHMTLPDGKDLFSGPGDEKEK